MNSKESYQLNVDYSALEERVLALLSTPTGSTLLMPRGNCKSTLSSMWYRHFMQEATAELSKRSVEPSAPTTWGVDLLSGMRADSITYHKLFKELEIEKMQETNKVDSTEDTVHIPAHVSWEIQFPEGPNALPMKEGMYSAGDYWCQFEDLQTRGVEQVHDNKTRELLRGLYKLSVLLPGYSVGLGEFKTNGTDLSRATGPLAYVDVWETVINGACLHALHTLRRAFKEYDRTFYDGEDVVTARAVEAVQKFTGYKVHKQAVELFEEIMLAPSKDDRLRYTAFDYSGYSGDYQVAALLMKLHGFVVSRFAIPLGVGFRNGEPLIMLGQPQLHKDYPAVTKYRCVEMRIGKWLASYYGSGIDFRTKIEDLKALNVDPSTYLCTTEREWYDAYEGGQGSCMTGYNFEDSPVRVYATTSHGLPDNKLRLFIQYTGELFGEDFEVVARAIVDIENNTYVRAYGNAADAILRANGYAQDTCCLGGKLLARIAHPRYDGAVLMPYLDGDIEGVDEYDDNAFVITAHYDYEAQDSDGYIYINDGRCSCEDCGGRYNEEDMVEASDGGYVCEECIGDTHVRVVGRSRVYPSWDCSWSDYHDSWVYDGDVENCAVEGTVHDEEPMVCAQGYNVLSIHAEEHPVHGLILTEHAASVLDEPYLGNDEEEEQEAA